MIDLELPLTKRTKLYRFFEMVPALLSYGAVGLLVVLSIVSPLAASVYLLLVIITTFVKSAGIAFHTITGHQRLVKAQKIDWHSRLLMLEDPSTSYLEASKIQRPSTEQQTHIDNLRLMANHQANYPKPSQLYHAIIIAVYNEAYEVIHPTIESIRDSTCDNERVVLVLTYEERGGTENAEIAKRLQREFNNTFYSFEIVCHPMDLPGEVSGKGPNITYAGLYLQLWCNKNNISYSDVIVTTLDCDNRPYESYFDYVAYEYICHEDRQHLSFQPIALYFGNIWDAPAPMRVIATGNSFWTIISSMRPHTLRNFASHSQPMDALVGMGFWSKRSIVEDGHQYWRSYFYFNGDYNVVPIHVPIYQDAVMADTYWGTLKAQFKQLRRWGYGVSDIPYVAVRLFTKQRNVPFFEGLARFVRLVDSHVTLASMAILVTFGGWIPLLLNSEASRDYAAHLLPEVVSQVQRLAMVGLFVTILLTLRMLPPRPARYKRHRTVGMVLQWLLMPITSVCYSSLASFNAQTHLMLGRYLDNFDVTEKATLASRARAKQAKASIRAASKK